MSGRKILQIAIIAIIFAMSLSKSFSEGEGFKFGVGASFSTIENLTSRALTYSDVSIMPRAQFHFLFGGSFDLSLGLGYLNKTYLTEYKNSSTEKNYEDFLVNLTGRFFFKPNSDFTPYLGLNLNYIDYSTRGSNSSKEKASAVGFGVIFGGQAKISKNFSVFTHLGLAYNSTTEKTSGESTVTTDKVNSISLSGSSVGAIFYF